MAEGVNGRGDEDGMGGWKRERVKLAEKVAYFPVSGLKTKLSLVYWASITIGLPFDYKV